MKVAILVYKNKDVGYGHWYRSMALADELEDNGHDVYILGNVMFSDLSRHYFQVRMGEIDDLYHALHLLKPDWLVIDLQSDPEQYVYDLCAEFGTKTLLLNGVGRERESKADLAITQGYGKGKYSGAEYVILRREIFEMRDSIPRGKNWFVFGGGTDRIGLASAFSDCMGSSFANIIITDFSKQNYKPKNQSNHLIYKSSGNEILPLMAMSGKACVAMGMTAWELSVFKIPIYAFSISEGHLRFAKAMEERGLLKAYPEVGVPGKKEFLRFMRSEFQSTGNPPDEMGAWRVVKLMEVSNE